MRKRLIGAAMLMAVAACSDGDSGTAPDEASLVGVYALITFNGQNLPQTFVADGDSVTLTAGSVTLNRDKTFSDATSFTLRRPGAPPFSGTQTLSGTYVRTGNNVTFNMTSPEVFTYNMTLNGNTLTESGDGFTLVYRK